MARLRRSPLERTDTIATPAFELVSDGPISLSLSSGDNRIAVIHAEFFGTGPSRILVDGSLVEAFGQSSSFTTLGAAIQWRIPAGSPPASPTATASDSNRRAAQPAHPTHI